MVRDLVYLDECKYEVEHYSNLAAKYAAFIEKQDTIIEIIRKREVNCQKSLMTCIELRDSLELQTITLQKNLKTKTRAKRFWLITALAAATSAVLVHLSWKEEL